MAFFLTVRNRKGIVRHGYDGVFIVRPEESGNPVCAERGPRALQRHALRMTPGLGATGQLLLQVGLFRGDRLVAFHTGLVLGALAIVRHGIK